MNLSVSLPAGGHLDHFCALLEPFLHMSPRMCVRKPHEGGGGGPGGGLDAGLSSPEDGARGFPKLVPDVSSQSSCFMMVDSPAE